MGLHLEVVKYMLEGRFSSHVGNYITSFLFLLHVNQCSLQDV